MNFNEVSGPCLTWIFEEAYCEKNRLSMSQSFVREHSRRRVDRKEAYATCWLILKETGGSTFLPDIDEQYKTKLEAEYKGQL